MTDLMLLLEVLKFFFLVYGLYKAYKQKEKEKALAEAVENLNQRLSKLENVIQSKQLVE